MAQQAISSPARVEADRVSAFLMFCGSLLSGNDFSILPFGPDIAALGEGRQKARSNPARMFASHQTSYIFSISSDRQRNR